MSEAFFYTNIHYPISSSQFESQNQSAWMYNQVSYPLPVQPTTNTFHLICYPSTFCAMNGEVVELFVVLCNESNDIYSYPSVTICFSNGFAYIPNTCFYNNSLIIGRKLPYNLVLPKIYPKSVQTLRISMLTTDTSGENTVKIIFSDKCSHSSVPLTSSISLYSRNADVEFGCRCIAVNKQCMQIEFCIDNNSSELLSNLFLNYSNSIPSTFVPNMVCCNNRRIVRNQMNNLFCLPDLAAHHCLMISYRVPHHYPIQEVINSGIYLHYEARNLHTLCCHRTE